MDLTALASLYPQKSSPTNTSYASYANQLARQQMVTAAWWWAAGAVISVLTQFLLPLPDSKKDGSAWSHVVHSVLNLSYLPLLVLLAVGLISCIRASRPIAGAEPRILALVMAGAYIGQAVLLLQGLGPHTDKVLWVYLAQAASLACVTCARVANIKALSN